MNGKAVRTLARGAAAFVLSVASLAMVGACGDTTTAKSTQGGATTSTEETNAHTPNTAGLPPGTAPKSARVDLAEPTFSDPTSITNPLFPVTKVAQALQMGLDEGKQIRVEYAKD